MENALLSLLGTGLALWWMIAVLIGLTIGFAYPLMAWSVTRNIKGIRGELQRLNSNIERLALTRHPDTPQDGARDDLPLYIPGTHTSTGPLNIR